MTPRQVSVVRGTYSHVKPIAGLAADLFYGRLFETAPRLRRLFPADLTEQKRKLMAMLALAVANLDKPDAIPTLEELGRRHATYGVEDAHYEAVGAALLWTLEQGLGSAFTDEVREAWIATYVLVAGVMKRAAGEAATLAA